MPAAEISESLEWLSKVFAGAGAGAWRADVETGLVEYTKSLKEVFGMERPVMLLSDWIELLHPEDCPTSSPHGAFRGDLNFLVKPFSVSALPERLRLLRDASAPLAAPARAT